MLHACVWTLASVHMVIKPIDHAPSSRFVHDQPISGVVACDDNIQLIAHELISWSDSVSNLSQCGWVHETDM